MKNKLKMKNTNTNQGTPLEKSNHATKHNKVVMSKAAACMYSKHTIKKSNKKAERDENMREQRQLRHG